MNRDLWFEDFVPGDRFETDGMTLTAAQILDFAREWDPQPFHLDVEAAAEGPYGGLIASGFQTMLVAFRLWCQMRIMTPASMGSPGMDEIRWLKPVRPGDTLRCAVEVLSARESRSKPDRGLAEMAFAVRNQRGETVMTWRCAVILRKRPGAPADR